VVAAAATTPEAAGDEDKKALTARLVAAEQQHSDDVREVQALQVCALSLLPCPFAMTTPQLYAALLCATQRARPPRHSVHMCFVHAYRLVPFPHPLPVHCCAASPRAAAPLHIHTYAHTHILTYTHIHMCMLSGPARQQDKDLVSARDELRLADHGIVCSVMGNMLIALEVAPMKVCVCSHPCRCLPLYQP
jgi:hypothetical protein